MNINDFLKADFIQAIIDFILQALILLINIILFPINLLIKSVFPDLSGGLGAVQDFFDLVATYVRWVLDLMLIPTIVLQVLSAYLIFAITVPLALWGFKILMKWIDTFR